jgi:hypothetical protein
LAQGGQADVYVYDTIPENVRKQISHIAIDLLGSENSNSGAKWPGGRHASREMWGALFVTLCREYGCHCLSELAPDYLKFNLRARSGLAEDKACAFKEQARDASCVLDFLELVFLVHDAGVAIELNDFGPRLDKGQWASRRNNYVIELNVRLRRAGLGYEFDGKHVIRIDSTAIHAEVVVPTLTLLGLPELKGVDDEFRDAHKHYRAGEYDDAILTAGKSLESMLKMAHNKRGLRFEPGDTLKPLLDRLLKNDVLPQLVDGSMNGLRSVVEGIAVARNKVAAHGSGDQVRRVPGHVAAYVLHSTASAILLIARDVGYR